MRQFFEYLSETVWRSRLKSCFCVAPVRSGLIFLGYIHAVVAYVQLVSLATEVSMFWPVLAHIHSGLLEDEPPSMSICVLPPATDLAFTVLLLAGLHKRDVVLLRVYCWYNLVSIFLALVVYGLLEAIIQPLFCIMIVISGIYQIYVLLLVRSLIIEIEMNNADANKYSYSKDQGVVIIRDAESPTPRPVLLEGYRVLPALPAPDINTSVTTLATLNERPESPSVTTLAALNGRPESPFASKYNTLSKTDSLKTSTLKSYRTPNIDLNAQRSATLPTQESAIVHTHNTQKIGAIQSLAGPSNIKPVGGNIDTLKRDFLSPSATTAGAAEVTNKNKPTENTADIIATDTEDKDKSKVSHMKKRGFFKKSNKEEGSNKKDSQSNAPSTSEATKTTENKTGTIKKKINVSIDDSGVKATVKKDNAKVDDVKLEENIEAAPKKKLGLFKKSKKENKEKKKGDGN